MAKKKDKKQPNMKIAQLKEYMYKGSGKDPAVNELIKKLNEVKPKVKKDEEPNKPKVSNTYGIAVNPLTGKMERTTQ